MYKTLTIYHPPEFKISPNSIVFADYKLNVKHIMRVVFDRIKNIVEKRRKCWLPAYSPFPTKFSKGVFCEGSQKVGLCGKGLKVNINSIHFCSSLAGVCIAVCCHHRCSWTPYVGKPFFKLCGLSAKDFQIISSMSSWATCAWKGWSYEKKCEKQKRDERLVDVEKNIVNDADIISGNQPVSDGLVSNTDTQDQNNANTDIAKDGYIQTEAPDTSMHENYEKKGKTSQENGITQIEEPVIFKKGKSKKPGQIDNIDEEHEPAEDLYSSRYSESFTSL